MSAHKGKLLEQEMIQIVSGRVDPAIPNIWSKFCIYLKPYIQPQHLMQLTNLSEVFDIFRKENRIHLGYYDRLTNIVERIDYPSADAMRKKQEEIFKLLPQSEKDDIQKYKETEPQINPLKSLSAKEIEAEMIDKLSGEIGPFDNNLWATFKNYLKIYVDNDAAVARCGNVREVVDLLYQKGSIKLGDYGILSVILGKVPNVPAKKMIENYQLRINQSSKGNETATSIKERNDVPREAGKRRLNDELQSSDDGGCTVAKFRKENDDTRSVCNTDALSAVNRSVGKITSPVTVGTGFRVGSKYILTCWHVVKNIITVPGNFGCMETQDVNKLSDTSVGIIFNYKKDGFNEDLKEFHFVADVLYGNRELDYAVLELKNEGIDFPPSISKFDNPTSRHDIYFIGHPDGKPMKEDPGIKIFDRTEQLEEKILEANKKCKEKYQTNDYLFLLDTNKTLFHCSFQYGASGSPGIIVEKGDVKAMLMLQGGAPGRWHKMTEEERRQQGIPNMDLIEYGIRMETIFNHMKKNTKPEIVELRKDIFKS